MNELLDIYIIWEISFQNGENKKKKRKKPQTQERVPNDVFIQLEKAKYRPKESLTPQLSLKESRLQWK